MTGGLSFPPLLISAADIDLPDIGLDPIEIHACALRMWRDIASGKTKGKKAVLLPDEQDLWTAPGYQMLLDELGGERLGWKLSALCAVGPAYASVKIVGANAVNRLLGMERSCSTILLLDKFTMRPICLLEGTDISAARTATYASVVAERLLKTMPSISVFVFGGGPIARRIILSLDAVIGERIDRVCVRTSSRSTAHAFANSFPRHKFEIIAVADNRNVKHADLVITASNASSPVFSATDISDHATVLHLGGDEPPAAFLSHVIERGSVICDDPAMVSARNSQSLALYFSRRSLTLETVGPSMGIRAMAQFLDEDTDKPGPTHLTCVGLPSLDLYISEHIYRRFQTRRQIKPEARS